MALRARGCQKTTEEAGERNSPVPLAPPTPLALQNLGRATLAEAKFTFLYGAWGGVQNLGPSELRIVVVMGPPEPVLRYAVLRAGGHSYGTGSILKEPSWTLVPSLPPPRILPGPHPRPSGLLSSLG